MKFFLKLIFFMVLIGLLQSCAVESKPIPYGATNCAHCNMTVADNRFGAELVNDKGKPFFFDSAECLMAYLNENAAEGEKAAFVLVTDFTKPTELVDARNGFFLQSKNLPSPMGMNLVAVANEATATQLQQEKGGRILSWQQVLQAVKNNENPQ
ncbi:MULTISPECIES: nitrous oxide reductase accessory protein NosL [Rufibacter]|uniref:Copper chaperone NosL n=1 Tax=Rufibacter quisquiliarum TaxID=1549639 RepID=A0A839G9P3_9BACT|nr:MULTISPECIES: nitrous oxide reductase accessory protein NosL [Rufibacter]MBA9075682.1 copper chaperone NosL [Rufibacter quisquiliarum]